jgi:hypothetical protein
MPPDWCSVTMLLLLWTGLPATVGQWKSYCSKLIFGFSELVCIMNTVNLICTLSWSNIYFWMNITYVYPCIFIWWPGRLVLKSAGLSCMLLLLNVLVLCEFGSFVSCYLVLVGVSQQLVLLDGRQLLLPLVMASYCSSKDYWWYYLMAGCCWILLLPPSEKHAMLAKYYVLVYHIWIIIDKKLKIIITSNKYH